MSSPANRTPVDQITLGTVDQVFLVREGSIHETRSGDPYIRATLCDQTGEISAVQWETGNVPAAGLYHVRGLVEDYKGATQCKISSLTEADGDLVGFMPASTFRLSYLETELRALIDDVGGEYGDIVRQIFSDDVLWERFTTAPAATKNHHAHRSGLAEHTLSMAMLTERVVKHYHDAYGRESVDRNLLLSGTLLHDLGKIYELEEEALSWHRKSRGELVGHMAEMVALIHDACIATLASQGTRDRLIHMVLSHHGRQEWGSPVEPRLVEAMILHQVDMIDSRFAMFREATDGLNEGELSERVWALGGRVVR